MSQSAAPFQRRLTVTIGPLEEWRGQAAGTVMELESDGTLNGLRVSASINKTVMGQPQPSTISIWNLAADTRDAIRARLAKITLRAGWKNTDSHVAFQGSVMSVVSERSGPDIVTKIQALPGFGALQRSVTSRTFAQGMTVADVVAELAASLPGVTVSRERITGVSGTVARQGWSYAGSTRDALTRLADEFGFSWSIQDGIFQAVGDRSVLGGALIDFNGTDGGLISVTPLLSGPLQARTGVRVQALYVPGTVPGSLVRVTSGVSPKLSGEYRISKATYSLDTFSDAWTMELESQTRSL